LRNIDIAISGIKRAGRWLQGAKRALEDKRWDDVVYCSQMAVENATKAILISLAIDFPHSHDTSDVFTVLAKRDDIPKWFRDEVESISDIIAELAELRGLAGYGFEKGIDVEYFRDYAPEAYTKAEYVYKEYVKLLEEIFNVKL